MFTNSLCWLFRYNFKSQHDIWEDIKLLFANSILLLLTIVLMNCIFQNYATFEKIEAISSFANEFLHHLRIKKNMFYIFFWIISVDRFTQKIQETNLFNNRTVNLNHCVKYNEIHNIRKKVLVKIDDKF